MVEAKLGAEIAFQELQKVSPVGSLSGDGSFPECPCSSPEGRCSPSCGAPPSQGALGRVKGVNGFRQI